MELYEPIINLGHASIWLLRYIKLFCKDIRPVSFVKSVNIWNLMHKFHIFCYYMCLRMCYYVAHCHTDCIHLHSYTVCTMLLCPSLLVSKGIAGPMLSLCLRVRVHVSCVLVSYYTAASMYSMSLSLIFRRNCCCLVTLMRYIKLSLCLCPYIMSVPMLPLVGLIVH